MFYFVAYTSRFYSEIIDILAFIGFSSNNYLSLMQCDDTNTRQNKPMAMPCCRNASWLKNIHPGTIFPYGKSGMSGKITERKICLKTSNFFCDTLS